MSSVTERRVELPGRGTTFVREIAGPAGAPALVLLHGLGATAGLNWGTSFEALGKKYRVVAIDHRGHGRGIQIRRDLFRLSDCADDVVALADVLGLDHFIPVGYSMGGPIAQLTWHRHRDRVRGLVLCATMTRFVRGGRGPAIMSSRALNMFGRLAPRRTMQRIGQSWLSDSIPDEELRGLILEEMGRTDLVAVAQAATALARFSSRRWIGEVDVPTAVVLTELDSLVPPASQRQMADAIPGASLHPVPGDHRVCGSAPELFVPALLEACRSVVGRSA